MPRAVRPVGSAMAFSAVSATSLRVVVRAIELSPLVTAIIPPSATTSEPKGMLLTPSAMLARRSIGA